MELTVQVHYTPKVGTMVHDPKVDTVVREAKLHTPFREPNTVSLFPSSPSVAFQELAEPVMALLAKERTKVVLVALGEYFYPVWDYYINYYLYKFRIFDDHENRGELYQQVYAKCLDLLRRVKYEGNNFNRIKRYFNKSIYGLLLNVLYKKRKKELDIVRDEFLEYRASPEDLVSEVDFSLDMRTMERHIDNEFEAYFELCACLFGEIRSQRDVYLQKFRDAAYRCYYKDGTLLQASDFFGSRFESVFVNGKG